MNHAKGCNVQFVKTSDPYLIQCRKKTFLKVI